MITVPQYIIWGIFLLILASLILFGKKSYVPLILIFIYLLPRSGFTIVLPAVEHPLPFGYIIIVLLAFRWFFLKTYGIGHYSPDVRETMYAPVRNIFLLYTVFSVFAFIMGLQGPTKIWLVLLEFLLYYAVFFIYFVTIGIGIKKEEIKFFINGLLIVAFIVASYGILLVLIGPIGFIEGITYNDSAHFASDRFGVIPMEHLLEERRMKGYYAAFMQFAIAKRVLSSYGDPNILGAQLMLFISVIMALLLKEKTPSINRKIFLCSNLVACIMCLYLTGSRFALVGFFMICVFFFVYRFGALLLTVFVALTVFMICKDTVINFYRHRFFEMGFETSAEIFKPHFMFQLITRFPFGAGFGNTVSERDFAAVRSVNVWSGFNSYYVQLISRIGVFGLICLVAFFVALFRYFWVNIKYIEDDTVHAFTLGATIALITQHLNCLVNNLYLLPAGIPNILIICGIITLAIRYYGKPAA